MKEKREVKTQSRSQVCRNLFPEFVHLLSFPYAPVDFNVFQKLHLASCIFAFFVLVEFSVSFWSQRCAYVLVKHHEVRVRKT